MLKVTENDIKKSLDKVFCSYDSTVNLLRNNKFEDAFKNLNTVRLLNSEIITITSDYVNLNKQRAFEDSNLYLDRSKEKIITKSIQSKIQNSQKKIFNILKSAQKNFFDNNIKKNILARFYIERYLPIAWNNSRDILFLANLNSIILLKELISFKQKNIVVLNQGSIEVNNFISNNNSDTKLILVDSFNDVKIRDYFVASSKTFFSNCLYDIWYDFENKFSNSFSAKDAKNTNQLLSNYAYEANTLHRVSQEWLKNGLNNISNIVNLENINDLENKYFGKPVIIVCPGPSLEKDISYLKKIQGKVFICAVGHALIALDNNNIIPNIVLHIDPYECDWTEEAFNDYNFSKVDLLILAATCNNKLFKKPAKKIGWLLVNNAYDDWLADILGTTNFLYNSLNVGHVSLIVLASLGFKNIAFLGLDHAFKGDSVYADSIGDSKVNDWRKGEYIKWPSKKSGIVTTNKLFVSSIIAFEKLIPNIKNKYSQIKLYNCSSSGANIIGLKNITLKFFLESINFKNINLLKANKINFCNNDNKVNDKKILVKNFLNDLYVKLELLNYNSNMLVEIYKYKIFDKQNINKIEEANNYIITNIQNNKLLSLAVQKYIQDYNQRKIMIYNDETDIQIQEKLFNNLNSLFIQFKIYVYNLINNVKE
jgi:hypothetical protein